LTLPASLLKTERVAEMMYGIHPVSTVLAMYLAKAAINRDAIEEIQTGNVRGEPLVSSLLGGGIGKNNSCNSKTLRKQHLKDLQIFSSKQKKKIEKETDLELKVTFCLCQMLLY